ncbi:MAG: hypothetical protein HYZ26_07710 [Chloroflexi bacterium]|nr:hypothetical protein [Chloroflexota bacterium]
MSENERIRILEMIERGELSAEEGIRRMAALGTQTAATPEPASAMALLERIERGELSPSAAIAQMGGVAEPLAGERIQVLQGESASHTPIGDEELERWRRWWQIPLYLGLALVLLSSYWAFSAYEAAGVSFWFFCAWLPLLAGLLLLLLAWGSQTGTWVHVRVNEPPKDGKSGTRVAISIPLPLAFTMWVLRNFGHYIPDLPHTSVDELLQALGASARAGEPLYINVDDDDGTHVEVYIG